MCQTLSLSQKQILLGGILGDSYFHRQDNSIRFSHSDKQLSYLMWKRKFFNSDDVRKIHKRLYKEGYVGYYFEFVNRKHKYETFFNFIQKHGYQNTTKKISLKYLNELDSLGLAVWWMDDGCLSIHKGNRYRRKTQVLFYKTECDSVKKVYTNYL